MNSPSLPTTFHELIINSSHFKVEINDSVLEPLALIDLNEEGEYTVKEHLNKPPSKVEFT